VKRLPPRGDDPFDPQVLRRVEGRRKVVRQRRLAAAALLGALLLTGGVAFGALGGAGGSGGLADKVREQAAKPPPPPELPRGGREIFPKHRVVGFYGAPQAEELGILGIGDPDAVGPKLEKQARDYRARGRPILPAFELLATIASGAPGADGKYRNRQTDKVMSRYLKAARKAKALLVLDIQPGQADFVSETKKLAKYLKEPDVSLALDPEWRMDPGEIPGQTIGSVDAAEVNRVSDYLSDIVKKNDLPQKLLLIHQFTDDMIVGRDQLEKRPGVALTLNVDGFGDIAGKVSKYTEFTEEPDRFHYGFKLFYKEDTNLMTPKQVLQLKPQPDLVMYE